MPRTAITVRVVETALSLRVEVTDVALPQDVGVPAPRDSDERDESGRGLQIVAMLASRWGFDGSDGGATVWFELLPAARATRTPASMSA